MICSRHQVEMVQVRIGKRVTVERCPACLADDTEALRKAKALPSARGRPRREEGKRKK